MNIKDLELGQTTHFMWSNGIIYKAKVYSKKKTQITVETNNSDLSYLRRFLTFNIKTGLIKDSDGFNAYLITDMTEKQITRHNRNVRRKINMRGLEFRGGELYFDDTPVDKLNYVQKGKLEDLVEEFPDIDEIEDLQAKADLLDEIASMYKEIRKERDKWLEDENYQDDKEGRELGDAMMSKIYSLFEFDGLDTMLDED
jgi:hypothetical protein